MSFSCLGASGADALCGRIVVELRTIRHKDIFAVAIRVLQAKLRKNRDELWQNCGEPARVIRRVS